MIEKQVEVRSEPRNEPKSPWTAPTVKRLLTGDAQNNPGDSHSDGSATFS